MNEHHKKRMLEWLEFWCYRNVTNTKCHRQISDGYGHRQCSRYGRFVAGPYSLCVQHLKQAIRATRRRGEEEDDDGA